MADEDNPLRTMVLFGASGDLARRKLLPALYRLHRAKRLPAGFRLFGYARTDLDDDGFRRRADEALRDFAPGYAQDGGGGFLSALRYVRGGYDSPEDMARLGAAIHCDECHPPMYYLALPPDAARTVLEHIVAGRLPTRGARLLMEKPFGVDLDSARELNRRIAKRFPESHVHRIDHYLAKDTVRNLLVFRFANILFEPVWNRHYVDSIQVAATETVGVEERGGYYDAAGVVRDMIQNHALLMLAFAAMEAPLANDPESIRDRTEELLRSVAPPGPGDFLFGQYDGYRAARGVAADSRTPTFAAVRLSVRNWRWYGVPIYLMSGKSLERRVSEVTFVFKDIPLPLLSESPSAKMKPNTVTLRIHPDEGIRLSLGVKAPGFEDRIEPAALDFRYAGLTAGDAGGERGLFTGYERVVLDALAGRPGLSWRADAIESAWRIVEPMLSEGERSAPPVYPVGIDGRELAQRLMGADGRAWNRPEF